MKKLSNNYKEIVTDDGSITVFSKAYGEACHSQSGARMETQLHYIRGCKVSEQSLTNSPLVIFEAGFGVGIGLEETLKAVNHIPLIFITTEIDEELVEYVISKNNFYKDIKRYFKETNYFLLKRDNLTLYILIGDARKTLPKLKSITDVKFNCIFQDAFSPKKNSILWTKEWFETLKQYSNSNCIMSTYSSSSSIRKSMVGAGWKLYNGEDFGVKRSSTRARLTGITEDKILYQLEKSPVPMITDANYIDYSLGKL